MNKLRQAISWFFVGLRENKKLAIFAVILIIVFHYLGFFDVYYELIFPTPYTPNVIVNDGVLPPTPE
jgi:hypothetical protein